MGFTTSCFIRKNSKELQNKLADIGYSICRCANFTNAEWLNTLPINGTIHGKGYFDSDMELPDWTVEKELSRFVSENPKYVDCGENEELFLAIAALRSDSDIHQWFVTDVDQHWVNLGLYMPKGSFELCLVDDKYMHQNGLHLNNSVPAHKATVEELINHFK